MATISLYAGKINQMPGMIKTAKNSLNGLKLELESLKSRVLTIDSNVCNTDEVVNNIQTSTKIQEQKISSLEAFRSNCQSFIEDVILIDYDVSDLINQRKNEFYEKYNYLKPDSEKSFWERLKSDVKKTGEWCKEHWKLLVTTVLVIAAIAVIILCPASAVLLLGIAKGLLSGALIGGIIGGIASKAGGGSFLDGFEDGAFSGALTGAVLGGLGVGGQLFGKAFGSSCRIFEVIKHTSRITGVLSIGMDGFDILSALVGLFDPSNSLVVFNQKLHKSTIYNVAQFMIRGVAAFTGSAYKTMKPMERTCFVAGTLILTTTGLVAIERIKAGDRVISTNADTFETEEKTVLETYVREVKTLLHLVINKEKLITTADHPFYVKGYGFKNAVELKIGDEVLNSNGGILCVENIYVELVNKVQKVYNFQVEGFHTYYVGENNVLVHNAGNGYNAAEGVTSKLKKSVQNIIDKAKQGKIKYAKNYHGRLGKELESKILSDPDAVYVSGNKSQNLIYRKGDNVVIVESVGSSKGNVITSYGPDGARGNSGAAIFGGNPSDPGMPVTHDAIVNGKIPTPSGETMPPATQTYP